MSDPRDLPALPVSPKDVAFASNDPETLAAMLTTLARTGDLGKSAALFGLTTSQLRGLRRRNPELDALIDEALCDYRDNVLIPEANRRAVEGVPEPIYHQGERVGSKQVYSDRLLLKLLEVADPRFRNHSVVERRTSAQLDESLFSDLSDEEARALEHFLDLRAGRPRDVTPEQPTEDDDDVDSSPDPD